MPRNTKELGEALYRGLPSSLTAPVVVRSKVCTITSNILGTVSRRKIAVLLDFVQMRGVGEGLVHNCTIFLCSLDVRNKVQGGDPPYAAINHKEGCGGHN